MIKKSEGQKQSLSNEILNDKEKGHADREEERGRNIGGAPLLRQ